MIFQLQSNSQVEVWLNLGISRQEKEIPICTKARFVSSKGIQKGNSQGGAKAALTEADQDVKEKLTNAKLVNWLTYKLMQHWQQLNSPKGKIILKGKFLTAALRERKDATSEKNTLLVRVDPPQERGCLLRYARNFINEFVPVCRFGLLFHVVNPSNILATSGNCN